MRKQKLTFATLLQSLYMTGGFFISNDLLSYASSCAFGFFLSMTPVVILTLIVLIRILHASPETVSLFLAQTGDFFAPWDMEKTISTLTTVNNFSIFELFVAVALIVLARRFVASVIASLAKVFGAEQKSRPVMTQVFIIFVEALIVVFLSSIAFTVISLSTMSNLPFLPDKTNYIKKWILKTIDFMPYFLVFVLTSFSYRTGSRTRPGIMLSLGAAFSATLVFWLFIKAAASIINLNAYNVIYGVLGNIIVLLLAVWIFFCIFLFFAQWVYVIQFFDTLLLCELYILPSREDSKFSSSLKRSLFMRPSTLLLKERAVLNLKEGENIYLQGEKGSDTYYIVKGSVKVQRANHIFYLERGDFFGEEACILDEIRTGDASAVTDVQLIKIPEDLFFSLLDRNPEVSRRALSKISMYFARYYAD